MKRKCIAVYVLMIAFLAVTAGCATAQTDKGVKTEASAHESHTSMTRRNHPPPTDADKAQHADDDMKNMHMMQEHLKKMDSRMEKIRSAADPQERHKLMQEHMADMKEGMKMMKAMPRLQNDVRRKYDEKRTWDGNGKHDEVPSEDGNEDEDDAEHT